MFDVEFYFFFPLKITELISTGVVLHLANSRNEITSRKILCIVGMAILHIIAGGFDQFIVNVFKGEGMHHQVQITLEFFYEISICVIFSENFDVFSSNE